MKTTQLACTPDVAIAAQRNFGPLHCDGKHKHASLLGGRDELTREFPSRATAAYTGDTCARLADTFVRSSPLLRARLPNAPISVPARTPFSAANAVADPAAAKSNPLDIWASVFAFDIPSQRRGVDASAAYLYAAREDLVADAERRVDTALASEHDTAVEALAHIASDDLSLTELKHEIAVSSESMEALRAAAPLNGQALRPDYLFKSDVDGMIFAGIAENFAGDAPSYRAAMNSAEYKQWEDAIETEIANLKRNDTFIPVMEDTLPTWNAHRGVASEVVGTLYVLKRKRNEANVIT